MNPALRAYAKSHCPEIRQAEVQATAPRFECDNMRGRDIEYAKVSAGWNLGMKNTSRDPEAQR
jgi:hypothetical protein